MTPERLQQIQELYLLARERDPLTRPGFLVQACGVDEELRSEVESLLAQDSGEVMDQPAMALAAELLASGGPEPDSRAGSYWIEGLLGAGSLLGPYKIEGVLGAGGMGEVYRAEDTRLGRKVAIKISPERFSDRFKREARAIAALNHPNICTLYDVGPNYLVMELIEGETLSERLKRGKLPFREVLSDGVQIADALAAAQAKGITHRDLKPGNIMISGNRVKVLDFGLAKSIQDETVTVGDGVMGTPAYMAPEQKEGKPSDGRTDIYALGLILAEMATGKRNSSEGLSAPFGHVVERCLEADPAHRWQSASDVRAELEWAGKKASELRSPGPRKLSARTIAELVVSVIAVAAVALAIWTPWRSSPAPQPFRSDIAVPKGTFNTGRFEVSPDGHYIAFTARSLGRGVRSLWVRKVGAAEERILPGAEGAAMPFWSPDSQFIAAFTATKLIKVSIEPGPLQTICECSGIGGSWNKDNVIIYGDSAGHLMRVSASPGATPTIIAEGPASYPVFLPDGQHFLYRGGPGNARVYVGSLDGKIPVSNREVAATSLAPAYAPSNASGPGHLLFMRDGTLFAQQFDERRLEAISDPIALEEHLETFANVGYFSVSANDVLVYRVNAAVQDTQLTWFDTHGGTNTVGEPGSHITLALSPNGKQAAFGRFESPTNPNTQVWLLDLVHGRQTPFTSGEGSSSEPVWSPNGSDIVFLRNREGRDTLYHKPVGGGGETQLLTLNRALPRSWSPKGFVLYQTWAGSADLWMVSVEGDHKQKKYLTTEFDEALGVFSPDGEWVAYSSNASGQSEVYVRNVSAAGSTVPGVQVSNGGGGEPHWRGGQLFYRAGRNIMSVGVTTTPAFHAGSPTMAFTLPLGADYWDVTADGQLFLVAVPLAENTQQPFTVVLNWRGMLKK